jgi:hypothetical protein
MTQPYQGDRVESVPMIADMALFLVHDMNDYTYLGTYFAAFSVRRSGDQRNAYLGDLWGLVGGLQCSPRGLKTLGR